MEEARGNQAPSQGIWLHATFQLCLPTDVVPRHTQMKQTERMQEICSWDGNRIQSSWVFIQYLLSLLFVFVELRGRAVYERTCHHQQNLCISQNPFFTGKIEHRPKETPLNTLWPFSWSNRTQLTFFTINQEQMFSKKVALLQLERGRSRRAGTVNSYWIILTA